MSGVRMMRRAEKPEVEEKKGDAGMPITVDDEDMEIAETVDNSKDAEMKESREAEELEEPEEKTHAEDETVDEDAPRRSARTVAIKPEPDEPSSRSRRRRTTEPVRYSQLQDQDHAIAKLKYQQAVFRKGEKRPLESSKSSGSSSSRNRNNSKRTRAEERRGARQARRREALSPQPGDDAAMDADEDALWRAMPPMALDGSGAQSKHFTKVADAVHATVLHPTTWRHVQLQDAKQLPSNLLPNKILEPFATSLDKPLDEYDDQVAQTCKVLLSKPVSMAVPAADDMKSHVASLLAEALPLAKSCHAKRVAHVLETTRRDVRACLALLSAKRRPFLALAKENRLEQVPIPKLHQVAATKLLENVTPATQEDAEDAMPTYFVGKGEHSVRERAQLPKEMVLLNALPSLSRSTTCIGVRATLPVDDDPIIRYVPYFSQATKADTQFTQFPSFEAVQKAAVSALDDEVNEYALRYVVRACDGDARVFPALRDLAWCLQPQTDYTTLQLRVARERVARLQHEQQQQRRPLQMETTLRQRLCGGPGDLSERQRAVDGGGAGGKAPPESLLSGFRALFCRRCYVYNCQLHGGHQPIAQTRIDPVHPTVKTSLRHLLSTDDALEVDEDGDQAETSPAETLVTEVTTTTEVEERTEIEIEMEADAEVTEVRRSVRSVTAAATKASSLLVNQFKKPQRKRSHSGQGRSLKRNDPDADSSEYFGYEAIYRQITTARRTAMLHDGGEGCSHCCFKTMAPSDERMHQTATWSAHETTMLELAERKLGSNACVLAYALQSKTCVEVHQKLRLQERVNATAVADEAQSARADLQRLLHATSSSFSSTQLASVRANNQDHLLRTRFQRMKDRGANHQFAPCNHAGGHVSCNANDCSCMRRDHFCEKSCGCARDCANRFPGCRCARGECGTMVCPCFFSGRECDPDVCGSCGASEIPALALDPSSRGKSCKKLRVCANTNILRGTHRKVGVAQSKTHGWGAFALEEISEGEFIYEYTGELLSQDEAERRGNVYDRNAVSFLFDLNEDAVVDAARKGNKSKFANHSSTDPNCAARIMLVNGDHRIGLYAKRKIATGEELFFDYGHHGVVPDWSQARIRSSSAKGVAALAPGAPSSVENSSVSSSPRHSVENGDAPEAPDDETNGHGVVSDAMDGPGLDQEAVAAVASSLGSEDVAMDEENADEAREETTQ